MTDIWSGQTVLTTDRLILRAFRREDLPLYEALGRDPVVMRYLGGLWSAEKTEDAAMGANRSLLAQGYGFLAVERRSDQAFLGIVGLSVEPWYPDDLQVGWRLFQDYWGQGYASEAGGAWLDLAFARTGREHIISMADTPNRRSLAVMRRLGMVYDHEARLRDGDEEFDATIYAISRSAWSLRQAAPIASFTRF
jgi:RimJ/RimL family protein N-acetyltransferase